MAEDQTSWEYNSGSGSNNSPDAGQVSQRTDEVSSHEPAQVSWSASEYLQHHHSPAWYAGLVVGAVLLGALLYLLTRSIFSAAIALVLAIIIGVFASRPPRTVKYELSSSGLTIGRRLYAYSNFKSFSVIDEGAIRSILLTPIKRFMPPVSAYFSDEDGDKIVDTLGTYLPFETGQLDSTQRLARKLRF